MKRIPLILLFVLTASLAPFAAASDDAQSAGATLLQMGGVRASALGNAFTAMTDDSGALAFNPASLGTLRSGDSDFFYERGAIEDVYGQVSAGIPTRRGGVGASAGYYNSGSINAFDGVNPARSVSAQRDLVFSIGAARNIGRVSVGASLKYLSSELVETYNTAALAVDVGVSGQARPGLRWGAAVQNLGDDVTYIDHASTLPRLARAGLASSRTGRFFSSTILFDGVYRWNEKRLDPALGLEVRHDALALRLGYQTGSSQGGFSMGAGFVNGALSIDYAIRFFTKVDAQQRVGASFRFSSTRS